MEETVTNTLTCCGYFAIQPRMAHMLDQIYIKNKTLPVFIPL